MQLRLFFILTLLILTWLPGHANSQPNQDQYVQIFYRTDLKGEIENDEQGLRGIAPYKNYQAKQHDLCNNGECILSIHQGQLTSDDANSKAAAEYRRIQSSDVFNVFVAKSHFNLKDNTNLQSEKDRIDYFQSKTIVPGQSKRIRLGSLHLLLYSLPHCSHEAGSLLRQVYQSQADADLFIVFLEEADCALFQLKTNPYHSLYDPAEPFTNRTVFLSKHHTFVFYRAVSGSYHAATNQGHLAKIRLHFRGRQLLGVEGFEQPFKEEIRNYPL